MRGFGYFYRHGRAGELLELFLVAAVSSLLITRFWLHITHYPTIGGHTFHIAHMLFGGILMMIATVLFTAFLGFRVQRVASLIAGIGFGLFIDELGKFITRDNNYFYSPTVALIYLVFVVLFLVFRWLSQTRQLTPRENLLNALALTEEVVIEDLDATERTQVMRYLDQSDQSHPLTKALAQALRQTPTAPAAQQSLWQRWRHASQRNYERLMTHPIGRYTLDIIFSVQAVAIIGLLVLGIMHPASRLSLAHQPYAAILNFASSAVAAGFTIAGVVSFHRPRLYRYHLFAISLLINIFVSDFFDFYQNQFEALPSFIISVVLYLGVRSVIQHERQRSAAAD